MPVPQQNDVELVAKSLDGSQDAFRQIVERYQTLICSLAYCATGSLNQSEDLAQETFVTAWKKLPKLREPSKLRSWLCGILRFLVGKQLRRQGREPADAAEPMEAMDESHSPEPQPLEQAISNEELAILWRSLEKIPEIYREPLVLFYREHQSIEDVAQNLELNEDAVKQRLSRGRKLLHEEVLAFVEGALKKTAPGKMFTLGVLAALSLTTNSATQSSHNWSYGCKSRRSN
jgi:RNA polymerase sigma factor (sigma-70 family)